MKNPCILYILLILLFTAVTKIYAQDDIESTVKSPQVADMIRYGNNPVSMYSGRLDLQIPLLSVEDTDFSFPVSLIYNSSGFMPMKDDGLTGLNWSLSCGGSIVREVKGFPDDMPVFYNPETLFTREYGFMYFLNNKNKYNHSAIVNDPQAYIPSQEILPYPFPRFFKNIDPKSYVEASSDIYRFNFGHHSGKFMINFDGSVNVISNDGHKYDVDLSGYTYAAFDGKTGASSIKITTDDGYKYVFGGSFDAMEYSLQWQNQFDPVYGSDGFKRMFRPGFYITISSFSLSKIIAPSGRMLEILYKKLPPEFYNLKEMYNALKGESAKKYKNSFSTTYTHSYHRSMASNDPNYEISESHNINHILTKQAIIEWVKTDNQHVRFFYRDNDPRSIDQLEEMQSDSYLLPIEDVAGAKLNQVVLTVKNKNDDSHKIYRTTDLGYQKWVGATNRLLLESIKISNQGKYKLSYNTGIRGPSLLTGNIDHWNYWKSDSDVFGDLSAGGGHRMLWDDIEYNVRGSRDADPYGAALGMLTKINYPTGGRSIFEYERHDYSGEIIRNKASGFAPKILELPDNVTAGGSRIKSITDYASHAPIVTRHYYYRENLDKLKSSGILNYKPIYQKTTHYLSSGILGDNSFGYMPDNIYMDASNIGFSTVSYENDHVVYPTVIETQNRSNINVRKESFSIFYFDRKKKFDLLIPTASDAQIEIQSSVEKGEKASVHIFDSRGTYSKKLEYTKSTNRISYDLLALGLSSGEYTLVLEAGERSKIELNLIYEELPEGSKGNPMVVNKFVSYLDYPDKLDLSSLYGRFEGGNQNHFIPISTHLYMDLVDRSNCRGGIKEKLYYNDKKQLIKSESYNYNNYSNQKQAVYFKRTTGMVTRTSFHSSQLIDSPGIGSFSKQFNFRYGCAYAPIYQMSGVSEHFLKLKSIETKEYLYEDVETNTPTNTFVLQKEYTYMGPYYYLKSESVKDSYGQVCTTEYKYAYENESAAYQTLKQKQILSPVVEVEQKINGQTVSLTRNNYSFKSRLVIDSIQEGRNSSLLRTKYAVKTFDAHGNPNHVVLGRGKAVYYVWDQHFLIGKIENIDKFLTVSWGSQTMDELRKLVPEAFITSYDHRSILELSSITNVQGIPTYFDYNAKNGWLERVYSTAGQKKYLHNYYKVNLLEE